MKDCLEHLTKSAVIDVLNGVIDMKKAVWFFYTVVIDFKSIVFRQTLAVFLSYCLHMLVISKLCLQFLISSTI